jgi:hypothetical protein
MRYFARQGQPLNPLDRAFMESKFCHDFSIVHIHSDSKTEDIAGELLPRLLLRVSIFSSVQNNINQISLKEGCCWLMS